MCFGAQAGALSAHLLTDAITGGSGRMMHLIRDKDHDVDGGVGTSPPDPEPI